MIQTVIKRSGSKEPYDVSKLEKSVTEAARDADVADHEAESATRAVVEAVTAGAGDQAEVAATEIRGWALEALDQASSTIADAWRAHDEKKGK